MQAAPAQAAQNGQAVGALDAGAVRRVWADVLSLVSGKSKKAAAIVREATVQDVEGTTLVLGFKHTAHANMLNASPDVLIAALSELLGGKWQVRCEVGGQPGSGGGGSRPSPPRPTAPSGPAGPPPGPADSGPRGGVAVPQQAADAWPTPARPAGEPVTVDARAADMSMASARPTVAGGPLGRGEGWPTPAAVPGAGAAAGADAGFQGGWPTTAVPGGTAAQTGPAAPTGRVGGQPGGPQLSGGQLSGGQSDGWPTTAVPGGPATAGGATAGGAATGGVATAGVVATQSDGWPTTAVPGGVVRTPSGGALADPRGLAGQGGSVAGAGDQTHAGGTQVSEWPVTSTPGGSVPGGPTQVATRPQGAGQSFNGAGTQGGQGQSPNGGGVSNGAHGGQSANGVRTQGAKPQGGAKPQNGARPRSAIEQAREAASRAANAPRRGGAAAAPAAESVWEGAGSDEPPFDPDYDRPVADPRFPGLDPGDELLDDANSVRESSEEAALRLLSETLGAEKIGETTS